jgi:hypothetical protein
MRVSANSLRVAAGLMVWLGLCSAAQSKDFSLLIGGKEYAINAGETITAKSPKGKPVKITLKRNTITQGQRHL